MNNYDNHKLSSAPEVGERWEKRPVQVEITLTFDLHYDIHSEDSAWEEAYREVKRMLDKTNMVHELHDVVELAPYDPDKEDFYPEYDPDDKP